MTKQRPCQMIGPAPCRLRDGPERERSLSQAAHASHASPCRIWPHRSLRLHIAARRGFRPITVRPSYFGGLFGCSRTVRRPGVNDDANDKPTLRSPTTSGIWHHKPNFQHCDD